MDFQNGVVNFIFKIGFFFLIAYLNSLTEVWFQKKIQKLPSLSLSYAPTAYFPLSQGIILPALTTLFFQYPVGFNRNLHYPASGENQNDPARLFSLGTQLLLNFVFILLLRSFPAILFWSEGLYLDLMIVNLFFLIFHILPFYPSIMSYLLLGFFHRLFAHRGAQTVLKVKLAYRTFSFFLLVFLIFSSQLHFFKQKIVFYLSRMTSVPETWLWLLTISLGLLFAIITWIHKKNLDRYYRELRNRVQKISEEKRES